MKETKLVQVPRVSVSRERTINLGRFGKQYESEKIFISLQADLEEGREEEIIAQTLQRTAELLDEEVASIEDANKEPSK